jgi:hypothetical protein
MCWVYHVLERQDPLDVHWTGSAWQAEESVPKCHAQFVLLHPNIVQQHIIYWVSLAPATVVWQEAEDGAKMALTGFAHLTLVT